MFAANFLSAVLMPIVASAPNTKTFPVPDGPSAKAKEYLETVIEPAVGGQRSATERIEDLTTAFDRSLEVLAPQSLVAERLSVALQASRDGGSAQSRIENLQKVASEMHQMLSFAPLREAEMPEGMPTYTPVGVIEVKQYPNYRMAVAGAFFTLFRHIQRNKIAMTAPVQMEFEDEKLAQSSMGFLYGSVDEGTVGQQGRVTVVDVEPSTVVSTGVRGRRTNKLLSDNVGRLERWLADNPSYEAAGTVRVMGYNSPFVPASKQYFEVQIPIRPAR